MSKIKLNEFPLYRSEKKKDIALRINPDEGKGKREILICGSTGCHSNKSEVIYNKLNAYFHERGLDAKIRIVKTGCFGFCEQGPIMKFFPEKIYYIHVTPDDVDEIIAEHIEKGEYVKRLMLPEQIEETTRNKEIKIFDKQKRIVLRNNGLIDPENIDEYIAVGGYAALVKTLSKMSPEDVINELKLSGLRGRGGGGYPTWQKWTNAKKSEGERKFIICNGDEGDPGAFMDRSVLEGDPHSVIEAMIIAGYTIGASQGFFYVRAEYGLAIERVKKAISQAYEYGMLGKYILGSNFSFDLDIRLGAGAFVCGEETALIASIEGKRGSPSPRPPYPSVKGLFGCPTIIQNVETLANIPEIIVNGGEWFSEIGTATSKGTKVFALTGKIKVSGLIEVPMGTTIREIVYDIGGGLEGGKKAKAVQTGGPSGGIIPEALFDTPIDYESLLKLGSMMGSGGMIVMDENDSMVEIAKYYLGFSVDESCGKCAPCRIGSYQMLQILERLSKKRGKEEDFELLKDIALAMKKGSLCGLGQAAPNPVISTMKYFEPEYLECIKKPKIFK